MITNRKARALFLHYSAFPRDTFGDAGSLGIVESLAELTRLANAIKDHTDRLRLTEWITKQVKDAPNRRCTDGKHRYILPWGWNHVQQVALPERRAQG